MKPICFCVICLVMCLSGAALSSRGNTAIGNSPIGDASESNSNTGAPNTVVKLASAEQTGALVKKIDKYRGDYHTAQWRYSWTYHLCVYLAALFSALAAWLTKVHLKWFGLQDPTRRDNWTASLAAGAALLLAISAAGKLADSWQDNKTRRYAAESLLTQLEFEQNLTSEELEAYGKRFALIIDPNTELVIPPH